MAPAETMTVFARRASPLPSALRMAAPTAFRSFEEDRSGLRLGDEVQVRATTHGFGQVGARRRNPGLGFHSGRDGVDAVDVGRIRVRKHAKAGAFRSGGERSNERRPVFGPEAGNRGRPIRPVLGRDDVHIPLQLFEEGQNVGESPARRAGRRPVIVVFRQAAQRPKAHDARSAAQNARLAVGLRRASRSGDGAELRPEIGGVRIGAWEHVRDVGRHFSGRRVWSRFNEHDPKGGIFAQARGEHAAGRAAADDQEIRVHTALQKPNV